MPISPYHPIQDFLFCLAGDAEDEMVEPMESFVEKLARSRKWMPGPPLFVNEDTDVGDDEPLKTVGGLFRMYSSEPPTVLEAEIDRLQFEQVLDILTAVQEFSRIHQVEMEIAIDGDTIGLIENGKIDKTLTRRYLDPLRTAL